MKLFLICFLSCLLMINCQLYRIRIPIDQNNENGNMLYGLPRGGYNSPRLNYPFGLGNQPIIIRANSNPEESEEAKENQPQANSKNDLNLNSLAPFLQGLLNNNGGQPTVRVIALDPNMLNSLGINPQNQPPDQLNPSNPQNQTPPNPKNKNKNPPVNKPNDPNNQPPSPLNPQSQPPNQFNPLNPQNQPPNQFNPLNPQNQPPNQFNPLNPQNQPPNQFNPLNPQNQPPNSNSPNDLPSPVPYLVLPNGMKIPIMDPNILNSLLNSNPQIPPLPTNPQPLSSKPQPKTPSTTQPDESSTTSESDEVTESTESSTNDPTTTTESNPLKPKKANKPISQQPMKGPNPILDEQPSKQADQNDAPVAQPKKAGPKNKKSLVCEPGTE